MGPIVADLRQGLITVRNDRGTFIRTHRRNGLDHIGDHIRIGNDDLFRLVTAQIGELFQHFFCGM